MRDEGEAVGRDGCNVGFCTKISLFPSFDRKLLFERCLQYLMWSSWSLWERMKFKVRLSSRRYQEARPKQLQKSYTTASRNLVVTTTIYIRLVVFKKNIWSWLIIVTDCFITYSSGLGNKFISSERAHIIRLANERDEEPDIELIIEQLSNTRKSSAKNAV